MGFPIHILAFPPLTLGRKSPAQAAEGVKGQLVFKAGLQRVLCLERGPAATGAPGAREKVAVPTAGDKVRANSVTRGDGGACAGHQRAQPLPLCTPFPCVHSSTSTPVPPTSVFLSPAFGHPLAGQPVVPCYQPGPLQLTFSCLCKRVKNQA